MAVIILGCASVEPTRESLPMSLAVCGGDRGWGWQGRARLRASRVAARSAAAEQSASPTFASPRATPFGGWGAALAPPERAAAYRRALGALAPATPSPDRHRAA